MFVFYLDMKMQYKVQLNDDLWSIANKLLGDRKRFLDIYLLNKNIIGINPNKIRLGQTLEIPNQINKINTRNYFYF
jgi:nucleoid-associated protein YgaU